METRDASATGSAGGDEQPSTADTGPSAGAMDTDRSAPPSAADRGWDIDKLPTGEPDATPGGSPRSSGSEPGQSPPGSAPAAHRSQPAGADSGTTAPTGPGASGGPAGGIADETATPEPSPEPDFPVTVAGHRPMSVTVSQGRSPLPAREGSSSSGTVERGWDRPDLRAREQKKASGSSADAADATTADRRSRTRGETGRQSEPSSDSPAGPPDVDGAAGTETGDRTAGAADSPRSPATDRDAGAAGRSSRPAGSDHVSTGDSRRVRPSMTAGRDAAGGRGPTGAGLDRIGTRVDAPSPSTGAGGAEPGTTFIERLVTRTSPGGGPGNTPTAGGSGTVHRSLGASPPSREYQEPAAGTHASPETAEHETVQSRTPTGRGSASGTGGRSVDEPTGGVDRDPRTIDEDAPTADAEAPGGPGIESPPAEGAESPAAPDETVPLDEAPAGSGARAPGTATSGPRFPLLPHAGSVAGTTTVQEPASLEYVSESSGTAAGEPNRQATRGTGQTASSDAASRRQSARPDSRSTGASGRQARRSEPMPGASRPAGTGPDAPATGSAPVSRSTDLADVATSTSGRATEPVPLRVATPVDRRVAESAAGVDSPPGSRPVETVTTTTVEPEVGTSPVDSREATGRASGADAGRRQRPPRQASPDIGGRSPGRGPPHLRTVRRILGQPDSPAGRRGTRTREGGTRAVTPPDLEPVRHEAVGDDDAAETAEDTVVTEEIVEDLPPEDLAGEPVEEPEADLEDGRRTSVTDSPPPDMTVTDPGRGEGTREPEAADDSGTTRRVVRRIRRRPGTTPDAAGRSAPGSATPSAAGSSPRMTVTDPDRLQRTSATTGRTGDARQARTGATTGVASVDELDIDAPELSEIQQTGLSGGPVSDVSGTLPLAVETSGPGEAGTDVTTTEKLKHSQKDTTKEMPALTVQSSTTDRTAPSEEAVESLREEMRRANEEAAAAAGLELGGSNAEIRERIKESYEPQPAKSDEPSIEPERPDELSSSRAGPEQGTRVQPDEVETEKMYPDFTFKRLAPQVDATPSEPEPRDITYREPERSAPDRPRETGFERADVSGMEERAGDFGHSADLDRMIEKLQRQIERRRRIDRERRGL